MHTIGLVLHPERDSAEAVEAVLDWASRKGAQVLGMEGEIRRLLGMVRDGEGAPR